MVKKIQIIFSLLLLIFISDVSYVKADKIVMRPATLPERIAVQNNSAGFMVVPIGIDQQLSGDKNYWQLDVKAEKKANLKLKIVNANDKNDFLVTVNQAATNSNLVVDYTINQRQMRRYFDQMPPLNFNKMTKIAQSNNTDVITLEPDMVAIVPIKVQIPKRPFKGTVVGGVNITKSLTLAESKKEIGHQFRYTNAIVMRNGNVKQTPKVKVLLRGISKKNNLNIQVTNQQPNIISNVRIIGNIKRKSKLISSIDLAEGTLTPQSKFNVPFRKSTNWKSGKYHLVFKIYQKKRIIKQLNTNIVIQANNKVR